jgi:uncharacterized protein (TIGR02145 family)
MKALVIILIVSVLSSCMKEMPGDTKEELLNGGDQSDISSAKNSNNILICHHQPNGVWQQKTISENAWLQHEAHGDIRLDDQDADGYVPNNSCGYGNQGDCNDTNAFIHPGVAEICNGIDDNCNGTIDETCFPAVIIGKQVWMSRNLDVRNYRNGEVVIDGNISWGLPAGSWCYYAGGPANGGIYGLIYNWYAVNDPRGLAPSGWHIPSNTEWNELIKYIDPAMDTTNPGSIYSFIAGAALKEVGLSHWSNPNTGASNSSGFTALPGGWRDDEGTFYGLGYQGMWWTSSGVPDSQNPAGGGGPGFGWARFLAAGNTNVNFLSRPNPYGLSVRCVRD